MLTKASSETDEGDVEDHEGHQALVPHQPHGPPDARHWHQGPRLYHLSQLTLLLHQLFLHQSFHTILMQSSYPRCDVQPGSVVNVSNYDTLQMDISQV